MGKRLQLNYCYFGALFVVLSLVHIAHVQLVDDSSSLGRWFYSIYAVGQCLFEVGALVCITAWIGQRCPAIVKTGVISGTFLLFLMHLVDFPLMRLMDMSIWYSLGIVWSEGRDNLIQLLKASHIPLTTWLVMGIGGVMLVCLGPLLFHLASRLSAKRAVYFSYRGVACFLVGTLGLLMVFDTQLAPFTTPGKDRHFLKALPWKTTFFTNALPQWTLKAPLVVQPSEAWYQRELGQLALQASHRPNIYLFVVESLREDFITPETAPTLACFREQNLAFPHAVAAANGTALSWFSIFHSVYPLEWRDRQPHQWSLGSLPLQLLKKAGYTIHLLSASQLLFYQMDQVIFGKDRALADDYHVFADHEGSDNYLYDVQCIDQLIKTMEGASEGHLFVVFLESTHFDYSWPSSLQLPTRPFAPTINYLQVCYSKEKLEGIKNRYRHAIHHIDRQFDRFLTALQSHPRGEEAVVIFTSDHGEEFFEEGRLFHASNLNRVQTHVPLYYRLGQSTLNNRLSPLTSHLDIFPTLIDYILGPAVGPIAGWFHGESILRPRRRPFALSARFNAGQNPYEFLLTTEEERLVTRFENRADIRRSTALQLVSRKNQQDDPLSLEVSEIESRYQSILQHLFPR